jgi:hypothetical protein
VVRGEGERLRALGDHAFSEIFTSSRACDEPNQSALSNRTRWTAIVIPVDPLVDPTEVEVYRACLVGR